MRHFFPGLLVGLFFGAGLALSEMTDPARVLGVLDIAGTWDPTLAFVLAAAIAGMVFGHWQTWLFVGAMIAGMWLQRVYSDGRDLRTVQFVG